MRGWMFAALVPTALIVGAPLPAAADPPPRLEDELARAEEALRRSLDNMKEAVETLIEALPQYELPQITEEGDIIIRRRPPSARPRAPDGSVRS